MFYFDDLPSTEEEAIAFLQERNILQKERRCSNSHPMKLYIGNDNVWKCNISACGERVRLRKDNWFEGSRLPFVKALNFIYYWCDELTSVRFCEKYLKISNKTVCDWNNCMREVCVMDLERLPQRKIGGPDKIVEIDESMFTKRKNHAGRVLPQQWIFGGICRKTKEAFVVSVPDRKASTLLQKIIENVAEGSTIYSDSWSGYQTNELDAREFADARVNYKYNFVDPETEVRTQTIKRMWGSVKWRNKVHRGTARHHLESYLAEFIWRKHQTNSNRDLFEAMLEAISINFPANSD